MESGFWFLGLENDKTEVLFWLKLFIGFVDFSIGLFTACLDLKEIEQ
jgi:uncharacterized membrane protein YiaA